MLVEDQLRSLQSHRPDDREKGLQKNARTVVLGFFPTIVLAYKIAVSSLRQG